MKNDNRREQVEQPMKKENSHKSGNTLWILLFTGMVCMFLVMGLLCYSFVGMKKELQKNSRTAEKKDIELSETISQMKQEIQKLNEKVLVQEQEIADYKKNAPVQGETAQNPQEEAAEENAMIVLRPARRFRLTSFSQGRLLTVLRSRAVKIHFLRHMRFQRETLCITESTENPIMKMKT